MNSIVPSPSGLGRLREISFLALRQEDQAKVGSAGATRHVALGAACRRVLVIEDHADTAQAIAVCLSGALHLVEVASDGEEGLAIARQFRPDVIFCDIWLPGVDGYYVTRALRKDPSLANCYLVAISGVPFSPPHLGVGFDEYLLKPVDGETLLAVMERAAER